MVSAGSYGGSVVEINNKNNIAIICPNKGQGTICELVGGRGLTIGSTSTGSISISNLQIEGLLTLSGTGNNYFTNCDCIGGITLGATSGNFFFQNCAIVGLITVPNSFGGIISFIQCNFNGASFSLNNGSAQQVQIVLCANLPNVRPTNAFYASTNSTAAGVITTDTNYIRLSNSYGDPGQILTSRGAETTATWQTISGGQGITISDGIIATIEKPGYNLYSRYMTNGSQESGQSATSGSDPDYITLFSANVGNFIPNYETYLKFLFNVETTALNNLLNFELYYNSQFFTNTIIRTGPGTFLFPIIYNFTTGVNTTNSIQVRCKTSSGTVSIGAGYYFQFELQQASGSA
jgi:hypothetical protein